MAKAIHPMDVVRRPLITEKGTRLGGENKYAFEVQTAANKQQIKEAVEKAFNVKVTAVNVMNIRGKPRRGRRGGIVHRPDWKKAVVTLVPEDKIELFEGI